MLDQIEFMAGLFQLDVLTARIDRYLQIERVDLPPLRRQRLSRLLRAALIEGELERGRVAEILGLSQSSARVIIRLALDEDLLDSPSEKGPPLDCFLIKNTGNLFPETLFISLIERRRSHVRRVCLAPEPRG